MASRKDDSMLHPLNGLFGAAGGRGQRELREHRLAAEAALDRARAKKRAEQEAALLASQEALREAQLRKEEEIRLAAASQAALETARAEAAAQARVELLEKQHEHERRMLLLRAQGQRGTQLAVAGLLALLVCLAGTMGVYFGKLRPENQRMQRAYDELVRVERARAEETKRLLDKSESRRATLAAELEAARRRIVALEKGTK